MNVVSYYDGISAGQMALKNIGLPVNKYIASEIDGKSIAVTQRKFPETVQIGDARYASLDYLFDIDLLLGGSPCQDLTFTRKGAGLNGEKSKLFFEFAKAKKRLNPRWFLFENVLMAEDDKNVISENLECRPIEIDSANFSAQSRKRLYWTNIEILPIPSCNLVLNNIISKNPSSALFYKQSFDFHGLDKKVCATIHLNTHEKLKRVLNPSFKSHTLTCVSGGYQEIKIFQYNLPRKLHPREYERLQGFPDDYTVGHSNTARYTMLGNSWNVPTVEHILRGIK